MNHSITTIKQVIKCLRMLSFLSVISLVSSCASDVWVENINREEIMAQLTLDAHGKTEVIKEFPKSFPEVLIERGNPIVYTRENSKNFEYIGMPIGGIAASQLYLGGDGQLWFWDIFGLNHRIGQLKGEEAYVSPYTRSKPDEDGARVIDQGFFGDGEFWGCKNNKDVE